MIVIDPAAKTIHCGIVGIALKPKYYKYSESPKKFPSVIAVFTDERFRRLFINYKN